jgi:hypothetical protein
MALTHLKRHKSGLHYHLVNTAIICAVMAMELGLERGQIVDLCLSGLLHGLGRACEEARGSDTYPDLEGDVRSTIHHLILLGGTRNELARRLSVANEYRFWTDRSRHDGTLGSLTLGCAGRLVAVAQAYDLITTPSGDRVALLPDEAIRCILSSGGTRYDEDAVRVLVNALGEYPVGSLVRLSDGHTAAVVAAPRGAEPTPRVRLLVAPSGDKPVHEFIELGAGDPLHIERCVDIEAAGINLPAHLL